jgi:hypothetical protein
MVFLAVNFNLSMNPLKNQLISRTPKSIELLYIRGGEFVINQEEIKRENKRSTAKMRINSRMGKKERVSL